MQKCLIICSLTLSDILIFHNTIKQYRNHPSIIAIKERCINSKSNFSFIDKTHVLKDIKNLQANKTTQDSDITTKLINPLSVNPTKWSNTLKQFVGNLPRNCLSVFDHFRNLALKGLKIIQTCLLILFLLI